MRIEKLTTHIGAELVDVDLAEAAEKRRSVWTSVGAARPESPLPARSGDRKAEHVAFASRFGALEAHPMLGSDPDHPGFVCIYKDLDSPPEHFESLALRRDLAEKPPMGAVLCCLECPVVGGDTIWSNMVRAYDDLPTKSRSDRGALCSPFDRGVLRRPLPIEKRHALKAQYPGRRTSGCSNHPETARRCCSSTVSRHISPISIHRRTCGSDRIIRPADRTYSIT